MLVIQRPTVEPVGEEESNRQRLCRFPDKRRAEAFIENLFDFVFSNTGVAADGEEDVAARYAALKKALKNLLQEVGQEESKAGYQVSQFFSALPRKAPASGSKTNLTSEFPSTAFGSDCEPTT